MSIASRITAIEGHIENAYDKISDLGVDLTDVDKNIDNIAEMLENVYEDYPKVTATGTELTLNSTKKGKMVLGLKGNTSQESTNGYNLFNKNGTIKTYGATYVTTDTGVKITQTNEGEYRAIWTSIGGSELLGKTIHLHAETSEISPRIIVSFGSSTTQLVSTIGAYTPSSKTIDINTSIPSTMPENATVINVNLYITFQDAGAVGNVIEYNDLQVEIGNSYTSYEPYTGRQASPNPDFPQDIHRVTGNCNEKFVNKNLFDTQYFIEHKNDFFNAYNGYFYALELDDKFKKQITASISLKEGQEIITGAALAFTTSYGSSPGGNTRILTIDGTIKNITYDFSEAEHVYFQVGASVQGTAFNRLDDIFNVYSIQLEKGSTASSYVPHAEQNYPVNLKGKNLIDISTLQNGYVSSTGAISTSGLSNEEMYSAFIKVSPSTQYTFKIFESSWSSFNVNNWIGVGEYTSNNTSSFIQRDTMTTGTQDFFTFTTSATTQYVIVSARGLLNATKIQLEEGSTATSYTPYFTPIELCKIGDYQDYIGRSTGKNLFDKDSPMATNTPLQDNGTYYGESSISNVSQYIKVKPNTVYTISLENDNNNRRICYYKEPLNGEVADNTKYISYEYYSGNSTTFTTPNECNYIRIGYYNALNTDIQIEAGSTATDYEPYGVGNWYKHGAIGKVVLDGTQSGLRTTTSNNSYRFCIDLGGIVKTATTRVIANIYSNNFIGISRDNTYYQIQGIAFSDNDRNYKDIIIFCEDTKNMTYSQFQTWLSTHNTTVYYPLDTPTTTQITDETLISQLEAIYKARSYDEQTNISQTNEDLPFIIDASALKIS